MAFEAYSVAIKLKLVDSVSAGLIGMASHFAAFNKHVGNTSSELTKLEGQLQRLKMMGFLGGAAVGIGGAMLYSLKGPLEEAKLFAQETARFASLGFGAKVNSDAQLFAMGMKTYGTSARDNMTLVSDAMAVFKDLDSAKMAAPILARMKFANEAVFGEGGKANETKFMDMLKVIEMRRGLSSPGEFGTQANFVQQVISGSRGRVDASAMLQALKTGGVAVSNMRNDDFYLGSEGLIQEFGGQRYGTAMMSIYQNLVQGRATASSAAELDRLGLLDRSMVQYDTMGRVKKFRPGAFKGTSLYNEGRQNPLNLLNEVLLPAFAAHGITTEPQILLELGQILGNRTGSSLLSRAYQQSGTLMNQWSANRNAQNIDQLAATGQGQLTGKVIELHKKWADVLLQLGNTVLPIAIRGVEMLTGAIKGFIAFAKEFPTLTKGLVIAFTALAGLMVAGGVVSLITAGFTALSLVLNLTKGASIGAMLIDVAGGLGALASRLGKVGVAGTVGVASYELATLLGADKLGNWLGGKVYDWTHTPYVANKPSAAQAVHATITIDGKKVGGAVINMMNQLSSRPQTGTSFYDNSMMPEPAGGLEPG